MRHAEVAAIGKLTEVFPQVLRRNADVRASDRALEQRPVAFDGVRVKYAAHVFFGAMVNPPMNVGRAKIGVGPMHVRADHASRLYIGIDDRLHNCLRVGRDRASAKRAVARDHPHDDRLVALRRAVMNAFLPAADKCFINLDVAAERPLVVGVGHELPKFMAHAPGCLVGDADLALNFLGRYPMARARHQIHGEKPMRKLGPRLVEDRMRAWIDVMAALLAGIGTTLRHRMKVRPRVTCRAFYVRPAEVDLHELRKAGRIVRVFGLEFLEGVFGHRSQLALRLRDNLTEFALVVKG